MQNKLWLRRMKANSVFMLLLLGLLLLRFPFEIALEFNKIPIPKITGAYLFEDGTYFITAVMILLKRDSLSDYHMGLWSLTLFMIAPAAEVISDCYRHIPPTGVWFRIGISICLFGALLFYRPKLRNRSVKEIAVWFLIAVAAGICLGLFFGKMMILQGASGMAYHPPALTVISVFIVQLSNAAVIEEPLFRGFLWGFLKDFHWKDCWIWLFQAALFWLGHIFYLGTYNYSFFIIIPLGALILGLIAWRSRSIGTSMIVHGLSNAFGHFIW